jgi:hypothetical protein
MTAVVVSSSSEELLNDPQRLIDAMKAGRVIRLSDFAYTLAPNNAVVLTDIDYTEDEEMVSLRKDKTGVENVVFVSPKAGSQHAARIKIAIDPPQSLNPSAKTASMTIHDYNIYGAAMPPALADQAKRFIERNKDALLDYWDYKIDTAQLLARLAPP